MIYNKDFRELIMVLKNKINLIITSPPYSLNKEYDGYTDNMKNTEYYEVLIKDFFIFARSVLKEDGRICLNMPMKNTVTNRWDIINVPLIADEHGFAIKNIIVWNKKNIPKRTAWGSWLKPSAPNIIEPFELIYVFYKKENGWKLKHTGTSTITKEDFITCTNAIWEFPAETSKEIISQHPTPFPIELPRRCIEMFSYKEDVILDPFAGTGTTVIASLMTGRKVYAIEQSEKYYDIMTKRANNYIHGGLNE